MYLLFSNYKNIIKQICFSFILISIQGYLPSISLGSGLVITCDLFLIYLTLLALKKELYKVIIIAFLMGIFQDFVIQPDTVGLFAFLKVISVYFISHINKVESLWPELYKIIYLLVIYFFHYYLYHFVFINEFSLLILSYIFLETIFNIILFMLWRKIINN